MYGSSIMNYALIAGGLAAAYFLYVSMKKPGYGGYGGSPGYYGGRAHVTEDGEISTMPYY